MRRRALEARAPERMEMLPEQEQVTDAGDGHAGDGYAGDGYAGDGHAGDGHAGDGHAGD